MIMECNKIENDLKLVGNLSHSIDFTKIQSSHYLSCIIYDDM